jgi:hypothetical protein
MAECKHEGHRIKGLCWLCTAENAELSKHLEEATQAGIDTAREITETLSKRLDEVEAENAGLREALQTMIEIHDEQNGRSTNPKHFVNAARALIDAAGVAK